MPVVKIVVPAGYFVFDSFSAVMKIKEGLMAVTVSNDTVKRLDNKLPELLIRPKFVVVLLSEDIQTT